MCHYADVLYVGETKKGKLDKIHLSDLKIRILMLIDLLLCTKWKVLFLYTAELFHWSEHPFDPVCWIGDFLLYPLHNLWGSCYCTNLCGLLTMTVFWTTFFCNVSSTLSLSSSDLIQQSTFQTSHIKFCVFIILSKVLTQLLMCTQENPLYSLAISLLVLAKVSGGLWAGDDTIV